MLRRRWAAFKTGVVRRIPGRKFFITLIMLAGMWAALTFAPEPYNTGIFSLGGIVLATDYELLKTFKLTPIYNRIHPKTSYERAKRLSQAKEFVRNGPDKINLQVRTRDTLRGKVDDGLDCLYEGLEFQIYIKAPYDPEDLSYDLRIATAEVSRINIGDDESLVIFLEVSDWKYDFEDQTERNLARNARSNIKDAQTANERDSDETIEPFAIIDKPNRANQFSTSEWQAIREWEQSGTVARRKNK